MPTSRRGECVSTANWRGATNERRRRPEEFKILALTGNLEGSALSYCEKCFQYGRQSKHSGTRHEQNVDAIYDTDPIDKRNSIDDYREDPQEDVARALSVLGVSGGTVGNSDQKRAGMCVQSDPAHIQVAMLTRLNAQRVGYLVQADKLVAFAIDFEVSTSKQRNGGGSAERSGYGQNGRHTRDGRVDQGGRRRGYVARAGTSDSRTCYGCGEAGHIIANCPKKMSGAGPVSRKVALTLSTGTCADLLPGS